MVHQGADSAPGLQALDQGTHLLAGLNLVGLSEELLLLPLGQVGKSLHCLGVLGQRHGEAQWEFIHHF
jgi:hypothetical protein